MATISGSSAPVVTTPIPTSAGQVTALIPVVQQSDGSYIGAYGTGDQFNPQYTMVAFDTTGATRWTVPNEYPQIATDDGGVIGQSGVNYDHYGTLSRLSAPVNYSWKLDAYTTADSGSLAQVQADPVYIAQSWWPFEHGNSSGNSTAADQPQYEPLKSCPGSSVPCAQEAAMSALKALRLIFQSRCVSCEVWLFPKLPGTSQSQLLAFLSRKPRFWDGTKSKVKTSTGLCPNVFLSQYVTCQFGGTPVNQYIGTKDAVSQTPADPGQGMQVFFKPDTGICNVLSIPNPPVRDRGVLNQATILHEALHGYTGLFDLQLQNAFVPDDTNAGSANVTYYLEGKVIPGGAQGALSCR